MSSIAAVVSSQLSTSSSAWSDCSLPKDFVNGHVLTVWLVVYCCPYLYMSLTKSAASL